MMVSLATVGILATGCAQTVAGIPARPEGGAAAAQDLQRFLLTPEEVDTVIGSTGLEAADATEEMTDLANSMSEGGCLGSLYNAQKSVYADTGWIGVVDQVLTQPAGDTGDQPEGDTRDRVEQTLVQVPSDQHALDFFNESQKNWTNCIGKDVTVDDGAAKIDWRIEGIAISGTTMTQTLRRTGGTQWACQHAVGVGGSHIVEVSVCNPAPAGEAMQLVNRILAGVK